MLLQWYSTHHAESNSARSHQKLSSGYLDDSHWPDACAAWQKLGHKDGQHFIWAVFAYSNCLM